MRLISTLDPDRQVPGQLALFAFDADLPRLVAGPWDALGIADRTAASANGNSTRDPRHPYGDHPRGYYAITGLIATSKREPERRRFGPGRFVLMPVRGQCLVSARNGRYGLLIHGGDPGKFSKLRATYGCLRISNDAVSTLMELWYESRFTSYRCYENGDFIYDGETP